MIASHVMSESVKTLPHTTTVTDAIILLKSSHLNDVPVIDDNQRVVGTVTAKSILHHALPDYVNSKLLATMQAAPDIQSMYKNIAYILQNSISIVLDTDIVTVKPATATSAIGAMLVGLNHDTHNILVIDEADKLVGIISARDILNRLQVKPG